MGQCISQPPSMTYEVKNPAEDLDMTLFSVSRTQAFNRGILGSSGTTIRGIQGVTFPNDYLPSLKKKRSGTRDDDTCRLVDFALAVHGNPRGITAKALLTTKAPRLTRAGPPTLDIKFQDGSIVRVSYSPMPSKIGVAVKEDAKENAWMASSIDFGDAKGYTRFRIQLTRENFPFLVQLFDGKTNATTVSILTFGPELKHPRIIHAFRGNVDTAAKARQQYISKLFAIMDEDTGTLAFQDALRTETEKAVLCIMLLIRTRILTFNADWSY